MIKVITMRELAESTRYTVGFGAWDYPINELDYLAEERENDTFVLSNGRLLEVEDLRPESN